MVGLVLRIGNPVPPAGVVGMTTSSVVCPAEPGTAFSDQFWPRFQLLALAPPALNHVLVAACALQQSNMAAERKAAWRRPLREAVSTRAGLGGVMCRFITETTLKVAHPESRYRCVVPGYSAKKD